MAPYGRKVQAGAPLPFFTRLSWRVVQTHTAYRAETALAIELRQHLARKDASALLQDLFTHDADLDVDEKEKN